MGGEVITNLIKIGLILLVAILLVINIWQTDELEERVLNVGAALDETRTELGNRIDDLAERGIRAGPVVPGTDATPEDPSKVDPRTLPYWPTEDNILVDLVNEPGPPEGAPRGGIIRYYAQSNHSHLNSHIGGDAELQEKIVWPVYEHMAEQSKHDPDHHVPGLCNRVTANEDFTEFICYVRKGMIWHKPFLTQEEKRGRLKWLDELPPQEVTAEDIKFNFDIIVDPLSECGRLRPYLLDVESVEVLDKYTVRIRWKRSRYYNKNSTLSLLFIYPKFIYERNENGEPLSPELIAPTYPQHWFNKKMCGTGPFQFAGFVPNKIIRLRRNDAWWNPNKPVIDGIDLRIVQERAIQLAMFKAGEIDLLDANPRDYRSEVLEGGPGSVRERVEKGEVTVEKWEAFVYYFVGWNLRRPMLREKEVRLALAHLYPKDRVIRDVCIGLGKPANGPVHYWQSHYDPSLPHIPYDPEKAAAILDAAGWKIGSQGVREKVVDGKPTQLRINVLYPSTSTTARDVTLLYQKSAEKVGVLLEHYGREWTVMLRMLDDKDFDACMLGWANSWDSDPSQIWHSESARMPKGDNFVSYIKPELDEVIEGLKVTFEREERRKLWTRFQRLVFDDQPYCFTYVPIRTWFINNRLGNHYFAKLRPQDWLLPWTVKKPG